MARSEETTARLLARARRLQLLDGRTLLTRDGPLLVWPEGVRDGAALVAACREADGALPAAAAVVAPLVHRRAPVPVTARFLAGTHRALLEIEALPRQAVRAASAGTLFRGRDPRDAAWRRERRARLETLSALLGAAASPPPPPAPARAPAWFGELLRLVETIHGAPSRAALAGAALAAAQQLRSRRPEAKERIEALLARLRGAAAVAPAPGDDAALDAFLARTVAALRAADRRPGRSRARLLRRLVDQVIAFPDAPARAAAEGAGRAVDPDLVAAVEALARAALAERPARGHTGPAAALAPIYELYAELGLLFPAAPAPAPPVLLSAAQLAAATKLLAAARELARPGLALDLGGALALAELTRPDRGDAAPHVHVVHLRAFVAHATPEALRAYTRFVTELVPHYAALGVKVDPSPQRFWALVGTRDVELSLLVQCLVQHHDRPDATDVERETAVLDATLGLFAEAPARARTLLAELTEVPAGTGRRAHPDFAAWLGDDALLDRYLHLSRLAGEAAAPSRALLVDFERDARLAREEAHLRGLARRDARQERRLLRLAAGAVEAAGSSARTRRRLQDRAAELLARAYRRRLDEVLLVIVREAWGIRLPALTPAWRDLLRFRASTSDNRALLDRLVRLAIARPGAEIRRGLAPNQAWERRMAARLDVDAWLQPRRRTLVVGERRYQLATEEDPLEVLRMGIPFNTCLSLHGGVNAASTVVNALDANKRVLYLRDERGTLVARQLLALTREGRALAYNLYSSLGGEAEDAIEDAFGALRDEIAEATRARPADTGAAEQLHEGFWYDDGPVRYAARRATPAVDGADRELVAAYCARLGRPLPARVPEALVAEARLADRLARGDAEGVLAALPGSSLLAPEALAWLCERDDLRRVARRLEGRHGDFLLHALADRPLEVLAAAPAAGHDLYFADIIESLAEAPRTLATATALVDYARRTQARRPPGDTYPYLDRALVAPLAWIAPALDLAQHFALCERLDEVIPAVAEDEMAASLWRERTIAHVVAAYRRRPDALAVLAVLRSRRARELTQAAALRIASTLPLDAAAAARRVGRPALLDELEPPTACRAARQALARLVRRRPDWAARPEVLAAGWRQWPIAADHEDDPRADAPPFAAFAELALHLPAVDDVLAHWAEPELEQVKSWSPGAWELAFHRRHPHTRWRARLVAAARRRAHPALLGHLALCGDVAALAALAAATPRGTSHPPVSFLPTARLVAAQLEGDAPAAIWTLAAAGSRVPDAAVDPATRAAAIAGLAAQLAAPHPDADWRHACHAVLARERSAAPGLAGLLYPALAKASRREGAVVEAMHHVFALATPYEASRIDVDVFAAALGDADLRAAALECLARWPASTDAASELRAILCTAAVRGAPAEALADELFLLQAAGDGHVEVVPRDRATRARRYAAAVARLPPERALELYAGREVGADASLFLDAVAAAPPEVRARLLALRDQESSWSQGDEDATLHAWLAALDGG